MPAKVDAGRDGLLEDLIPTKIINNGYANHDGDYYSGNDANGYPSWLSHDRSPLAA
jgi:hypothetical protein